MWASAGYLGLPSFTAKYVCQCLGGSALVHAIGGVTRSQCM